MCAWRERFFGARWAKLDGEERLSGLAGFLPNADLVILPINIDWAGICRGFWVCAGNLESGSRIGVVVLHCCLFFYLHFQARRDLLMRELGSFFFSEPVILAFMPFMRAQNDFLRAASFSLFGFGAGALRFPPCALLYEALPLAFNPPLGFLPSLRVHASLIVFCVFCLLLVESHIRISEFKWDSSPATRPCKLYI